MDPEDMVHRIVVRNNRIVEVDLKPGVDRSTIAIKIDHDKRTAIPVILDDRARAVHEAEVWEGL
jgi:hypothetical protein